MTGLILKDIYNLKRHSKVYVILLIFYFFLSRANGNATMFGSMLSILAVMLPITAMAYDEKNNWDRYALTMQLSRKDLVLSRYILGLIFALIAFIISIVSSLLFNKELLMESIIADISILSSVLLLIAFVFPVLFKFGIEKGRTLMIIILFAPTMLLVFLSNLGIKLPDEEALKPLLYFSPVAIIIIFILSIFVSISIYNKKEF
ncbi:MAG TPA: ABC-2 transporter permease [Epulopiscium sp.]|nr:ABC-2 transporter permease [Candidatus Epulonipiscium sp.]